MKKFLTLSVLVTLILTMEFTAYAASTGRSSPNRLEIGGSCENGGWSVVAQSESRWDGFRNEPDCNNYLNNGGSVEFLIMPRLKMTLETDLDGVSISGTGFSADSDVSIDIRILSEGVIGGTFSFWVQSDSAGTFRTEPVHVNCPDSAAQLYVVAIDPTGVETAVLFDLSDAECN